MLFSGKISWKCMIVQPPCGSQTVGGRCARDVTYQRWDYTSRKPCIHGLQNTLHRLSLNKVSGMSLRGRETKAETRNDHAVREEKEVPGKRGVWASGLGRQPTLLTTHHPPPTQSSVGVTRTQTVNNRVAGRSGLRKICVNSPQCCCISATEMTINSKGYLQRKE